MSKNSPSSVYLKTNQGYFTVYGWDFRADFNKACALPFPNPFGVSLAKARRWLKEEGIAEAGIEPVVGEQRMPPIMESRYSGSRKGVRA